MIRAASLADVAKIASCHVSTWAHTYASLLPKPVFESVTPEASRALWGRVLGSSTLGDGQEPAEGSASKQGAAIWVAEEDARLNGFLSSWYHEAPSETLEIMALYVLPEAQGRGFGRDLVSACEGYALAIGAQVIKVWALAENEKATGFYQRLGFTSIGTRRVEAQGHTLLESGYRLTLK